MKMFRSLFFKIQRRERKPLFPVIGYLVYFLIVTTIVTGVSFSKYSVNSPAGDTARVAEFDVVITPLGWSNDNISSHASGKNKVYTLTAANNGEVAVRARLVIDSSTVSNSCVVSPSGWFELAALGGMQNVTVSITGHPAGNEVKMRVEYEQID
ncbi:MAG: hypothetical protein FWD23_04760 [Oscillospiraceae bacterium]|nr:hypothetical protein [Oscillospiraceae bacterium]